MTNNKTFLVMPQVDGKKLKLTFQEIDAELPLDKIRKITEKKSPLLPKHFDFVCLDKITGKRIPSDSYFLVTGSTIEEAQKSAKSKIDEDLFPELTSMELSFRV